jgi:hypothetical protein
MGISPQAGAGVMRAIVRNALKSFVIVAAFATGSTAAAQQTHVLIVTGLGGEPQYSEAFRTAGTAVFEAAKSKWGVPPTSLFYLAEDPATSPGATGKSSRDEVAKAFTAIAQRAAAGDIVLVFLLGHGSGEGVDSRVNLSGPDPTAADYRSWISGFVKQTVVFVNASSASGDFVAQIGAPGRIVVTATRTAMERNESVFAGHFATGLASGEADADKDGRVSVLEAFEFAKKAVAQHYERANKLQTEHAILSDTTLAMTVGFGGQPASTDPKVAALVAERRALEDALVTLRGRKAQMDSTAYETELERLLIAIAEKTQAIRAAGGR